MIPTDIHWRGCRPALRLAAATLTAAAAASAAADSYTEVADATDLPAPATWITGSGPLTTIGGALDTGTDADIFGIHIDDPLLFSATTAGAGSIFDTQLFLFDLSGFGIAANDDILNSGSAYNPRSQLAVGSMSSLLAPGVYYLAISGWDRDPHSAGGAIFTDDVAYTGTVGPAGPGGATPVSGWDSDGNMNSGVGTYTISLTGASFVQIPEPPTMLVLVVGTAWAIRRRLCA